MRKESVDDTSIDSRSRFMDRALDATVAAAYARVPDDERLSTHSREPSPICCAGWRCLCVALSVRSSGVAGVDTTVDRFPIRSDGFHLDRATHSGAFFDVVGRRSATVRVREPHVRSLGLSAEDRRRLRAVVPARRLPARHRRPRHHGLDSRASRVDHARLRARGVHGPADHVRADRRARDRHPARRRQRAATDHHRVVPAAAQADVARAVDDRRLSWDADAHVYAISDETGRYAGVIGSPSARDVSVMPYQEEPRDIPNRFVIEAAVDAAPAASDSNRRSPAASKAARRRARPTTRSSARCGRSTSAPRSTTSVSIATRWASPRRTLGSTRHSGGPRSASTKAWRPIRSLGTGLVAGFRTSGDSERPGFAWFFGRDALWTTLATNCRRRFRDDADSARLPARAISGRTARSRTRSRSRRRSCRGSISIPTRGRAPMRHRST